MKGLARLDGPGRLQGVDLARGLAVVGMVAAHLLTTRPFDLADPATWSDVSNGRASILFATLAGVSIGLVTGGPRPVRGATLSVAAGRLAVRAALLWVLGVALIRTGVPIVNILPAYSVLFLLALPFLALPARIVLPLALAAGLVTPFLLMPIVAAAGTSLDDGTAAYQLLGWHYPFVVWIAFVIAGLGLARANLRSARTQTSALLGGAVVSAIGYGLGATPPPAVWLVPVWTAESHSSGLLEVLGSGGFAIAVIGLSALVCRTVAAAVVLPLRAVGSMPLTAYTVQVLVWWLVAATVVGHVDDLFGIRDLGFFWYLAVGVTVLCTAWALVVGRGPVEGVMDRVARIVVPSPPGPPVAAGHPRERIVERAEA